MDSSTSISGVELPLIKVSHAEHVRKKTQHNLVLGSQIYWVRFFLLDKRTAEMLQAEDFEGSFMSSVDMHLNVEGHTELLNEQCVQ